MLFGISSSSQDLSFDGFQPGEWWESLNQVLAKLGFSQFLLAGQTLAGETCRRRCGNPANFVVKAVFALQFGLDGNNRLRLDSQSRVESAARGAE